MKLMIVESPNKIKKIKPILGPGWEVAASVGHVRDLPEKETGVGEAPTYRPYYVLTARGKDVVKRLQALVTKSDEVYLATDPDREGEAIAWHLKEVLKLQAPRRVTFAAIKEAAIKEAVRNPRKIDVKLVAAQEARRVLDRIVGFSVSPVLSSLLKTGASAGRVQSPAVRLVVDREREIENFSSTNHFSARITFDGGKWSAEWVTKPFLQDDQKYILDASLAERAASIRSVVVESAERKVVTKAPPAAFSTSTLIQAASARLRFKTDQTAKLSQSLFEQGLITYHRTDSLNLSEESIRELQEFARENGLPLADQVRTWKSKEDAQEAHEAIRPTDFSQRKGGETAQEQALYELIWARAVGCQMKEAEFDRTVVQLRGVDGGDRFLFSASSSVLRNAGWLSVVDGDAANEDAEDEDSGVVPLLDEGVAVTAEDGKVLAKKTEPPARYTEASLVKKLENIGIGRPSTYASIMANIQRRGYVEDKKNKLYATEKAKSAMDFLVGKFSFVEYDFTRNVEAQLDAITEGRTGYRDVVSGLDAKLAAELAGSGVDLTALNAPSEKQIELARKWSEEFGVPLADDVLGDREKLKAWLDQVSAQANESREQKMANTPASEKQIEVIEKAIREGKLEQPEGWPSINKKQASALLDSIFGKQTAKGRKGQKSKRSKPRVA